MRNHTDIERVQKGNISASSVGTQARHGTIAKTERNNKEEMGRKECHLVDKILKTYGYSSTLLYRAEIRGWNENHSLA